MDLTLANRNQRTGIRVSLVLMNYEVMNGFKTVVLAQL